MNISYVVIMFIFMIIYGATAQVDLSWQLLPEEILELADAPLPPSILIDNSGMPPLRSRDSTEPQYPVNGKKYPRLSA